MRKLDIEPSTTAFFAAPHLRGLEIGYAYSRPTDLARGLELAGLEIARRIASS